MMECVKYGPRWYNYSFSGLLANILGLNAYAGGLIYPGGDWDIEAILQAEPDLDDELEEIRQSWEESGMQGTRWKLVSADLPGVYARVAESRDDAINDTGVSIYADLKFTHLGGATLSYCLSPEAAGSLEMEEGAGTGTLMKTVAVWWETEGKIRFDAGSGISRTAISLNGMECTRAEDTMIVQAPEWGAAFVFQYVEE